MQMPEKKPAGRLGVAIFTGGGADDDSESDASPMDLSCKAIWKAWKQDDYEGFKQALGDYIGDYLDSRKASEKSSDAGESDEEE